MGKRVSGVLLVLVLGSGALPAAQTAPAKSLIYCGWFGNTVPTPAFIAANKSFLETQPFHGLVAYLRNNATGFNATTRTMTTTPLAPADLATLLAPMRTSTFSVLRNNFGLVQGSTPPDFFDDWSVPIQNFANVAKALKDAGLKGIVFDNEQYFSPWGNYPDGAKYATRTLSEYQVQARLRGKQVMAAMIAQFPEIAVLTLHGPTVSEPKAPWPLFPTWYTANELLGPFFSGMMEGMAGAALNIDGGELYHYRSADEFLRSYNWRKYTLPSDTVNCAFIPPAMRPAWPGKTSISYGVYDRPFGGASMDPSILRTTLANALRQADRYVWFYAEGATYLLSPGAGGASATWVGAVRQGVADAGVSSSGTVPAAPTHLAAAATSATEIDLSWWDTSGNETGFEIERKTGSTGTWARILTTGANVGTIDDVGLAASTTYFYRARAVNSSGPSAYSNEVGVTTPAAAAQPPAAPVNFLFQSNAHLRISVKWTDASSNETGFEIQRKTGSLGVWSTIGSAGANITVYDDLTVTPGLTYVYRARSVNAAGASAWSGNVTSTAW